MKRTKHSLSHYKLLSMNQGELIPITWFEVLPGDTIQHSISALIRVSPLVNPVMHPVHARIHSFFVPNRLIWDDWEKFITGGADGLDASVPPFRNDIVIEGGLLDYLGLPTTNPAKYSMLPIRAYNLIWNEWFRDEDLETLLVNSKLSGGDGTSNILLQNVAWEKDYFTTSRPWTQKGAEVNLPLGTSAPVDLVPFATNNNPMQVRVATTDVLQTGQNLQTDAGGLFESNDGVNNVLDPNGRLTADLSSATASSINDLREAIGIQKYEEARARYGSRYSEYLRYLGVKSSDARLQRPEYLGGGKQTIQFSEVLQTAGTTDGSADGVGNLKGHGIGAMRSNRYRRFFEEHGIVMSFLSVKPKTIYADGIHRSFSRETKEDYWQKELQHIGQQAVLNSEVYAEGPSPTGTFGYQDRYDEYRRMPSGIAGEFRTTLDDWHMARIFAAAPALNASFVSANPTDRIYQSTATDQLLVMANHSIQARRMIAAAGTPMGAGL